MKASRHFIEMNLLLKEYNEGSLDKFKNEILQEIYGGVSNHLIDMHRRMKEEHTLLSGYLNNFVQNQVDLTGDTLRVLDTFLKEKAKLSKASDRLQKLK
jgi:hypothetical protein